MAEYGFLDRLLHRFALQVSSVAELSFDLDQRLSGSESEESRSGRHVFVAGLARAGTTILMRRIYASGDFCSLTYRNMPFVLAPNLWSRFAAAHKKKDSPAQRAHGDRILVDIDSPESLDEVFWRIFDAEAYIAKTCLTPHDVDEEITSKYAAYVSAILKADPRKRMRYLSKNNNNILRLGAIRRTFPQAVILIPFREPLSHAGSLLRQHKNFVAQQQANPFVRTYMTWLAHHEFGLDHRPFQFDDAGRDRLAMAQPDELDYWLEIWCQVYLWLEKAAPERALFVCYEDLCNDPTVWRHLAKICAIPNENRGQEPFVIADSNGGVSSQPKLLETTSCVYQRLIRRARTGLY